MGYPLLTPISLVDRDSLVVHVSPSAEAAVSDLPAIFQGQTPPTGGFEGVSTRNYSKKPAGVFLGAGFDDDEIAEIRKVCDGKSCIPWMRADMNVPRPPLDEPGYAENMVDRVKALWKRMEGNGDLAKDGVHYY